ncbi:MAG TPA: SlyX family protein, partial [Gammaproteobacteria bacterium]|nr:SlyX family protein [Gammaproteobacteria bacterium]
EMDEKLVDLETRIAFLEDAQQQLSDVIARQEQEIARLLLRVGELEEQLRQAVPALIADAAEETPPPHY